MCGIDVHMDPNIGKRLNALGNTLTTLTGEEVIDDMADLNSMNIGDLSDEDEVDTMSPTIHTVCKLTVDVSQLALTLRRDIINSVLFIVLWLLIVQEGRDWWFLCLHFIILF